MIPIKMNNKYNGLITNDDLKFFNRFEFEFTGYNSNIHGYDYSISSSDYGMFIHSPTRNNKYLKQIFKYGKYGYNRIESMDIRMINIIKRSDPGIVKQLASFKGLNK